VSAACWKAVLVDDERLARVELRRMLQAHADVEVVGEASTLAEAADLVQRERADVVFLDLQLHQEQGLSLAPLLGPQVRVVCVTAHDRYAVEAFGVRALDYLLKPVSAARLAETIGRLGLPPASNADEGQTHDESGDTPLLQRPLGIRDRLFLRLDGAMGFLPMAQIRCVEADGDCTRVSLTDGRRVTVRKTLAEWMARLPSPPFQQIHRATVINMEMVERIAEHMPRSYQVWLRGLAEPVVMSRRFAARLKEEMR
jgi:two-component system, LytTR family, response regulator